MTPLSLLFLFRRGDALAAPPVILTPEPDAPAPQAPSHAPGPVQAPAPTPQAPRPVPAPAPQAPQAPSPQAPQTPSGPLSISAGIAERELEILRAVQGGAYDHGGWRTVASEANGHSAIIPVMRRALALRAPDGRLVVSVSFALAQQIADVISALDIPVCMPTSRVCDLIWRQAGTRLPVLNQPTWVRDGSMSATARMIEFSAILAAAASDNDALFANEGKAWVITRRNWAPPEGTGKELPEGAKSSRHNGANFGWHAPTAPSRSPGGERVFQPVGLAHDRRHVDYSQLLTLMGRKILVDDVLRDAEEVARDPELAPLLSDEGPLPALRHPDLTPRA
jgi:hypothetical protein